jgi:hypothetical protein
MIPNFVDVRTQDELFENFLGSKIVPKNLGELNANESDKVDKMNEMKGDSGYNKEYEHMNMNTKAILNSLITVSKESRFMRKNDRKNASIDIGMILLMHIYIYVYMYINMYLYIYLYLYIFINMYMYVYVYIYIYIYTYIYTNILRIIIVTPQQS